MNEKFIPNVITLTSDFGNRDYTVPMIKGEILSNIFPTPIIIDITHEIEPYHLIETAYLLKNSYKKFPKNSIHFIMVDSVYYPQNNPIVCEIDGHYFFSNNNGVLSLITQSRKPLNIIEIEHKKEKFRNIFVPIDVFVPAVKVLLENFDISKLGKKCNNFIELSELKPYTKENQIIGQIIYIDNYGNCIANINYDLFNKIGKDRLFNIRCRNYNFNELMPYYSGIVKKIEKENEYHGRKMALFNINNDLEIALYKSNKNTVGAANTLLGITIGTTITIDFY